MTVYLDFYSCLNLGDDLFIKILLERYPNIQFVTSNVYIDNYKLISKEYNNLKIINESYLFRVFRTIITRYYDGIKSNVKVPVWLNNTILNFYFNKKLMSSAYVYLHIGGSIFIQQNDTLQLKHFKKSWIKDNFSSMPQFILGANFGPYHTEEYKLHFSEIFKSYTDICFREKYSYELFKDLPCVRYTSDIVFQLDIPQIEPDVNSFGFSIIDISRRKDLTDFSDIYFTEISSMISQLIEKDKKVSLFSFCKQEGDEDAIAKILELLPKSNHNKLEIVKYDGDTNFFLNKYAHIGNMFTTRFHAMILSLKARQNVYPLIYSNKLTNVLKDIKFEGEYSYIKDMCKGCGDHMLSTIKTNNHSLGCEAQNSAKQFLILDSLLLP